MNDTSFLMNCIEKCLKKAENHFGGRGTLLYTRVAAIGQKLMIDNLMYEMQLDQTMIGEVVRLEG